MHLVNTSKFCVHVNWGPQQAPTIQEWFCRFHKIAEMEELIAISRDTPLKYKKT